MFSVRSCSPPVMKILLPLMRTAIGLGFGAGADQPQVGAGVGLGQAHGAGPAAFVQRGR
jgi:uncharacterized spore protein YtfJ